MSEDLDTMTYMMAAEKMINMLFTIENTFQFLDEYKVKPDDEVVKALEPMIERMSKWVKSK